MRFSFESTLSVFLLLFLCSEPSTAVSRKASTHVEEVLVTSSAGKHSREEPLRPQNAQSLDRTNERNIETRSDVTGDDESRYYDALERPVASRRVVGAGSADAQCPEPAAIAPCVCSVGTIGNVNLDCTQVESEDQLAAVFQQNFPVQELNQFIMTTNTAVRALRNILNGVSFHSLKLSPGPFALEQISEYFLLSSKDVLNHILIDDSALSSDYFPFAILSAMEELLYLEIFRSNLTWIPKFASTKLTVLRLTNGRTEIIETGTFPIHARSMVVDIRSNEIHTVEPGSFYFADDNNSLGNEETFIDLSNNKLESLQAGTFPIRSGPTTIYVSNNDITSIQPGSFFLSKPADATNNDIIIDFSGNRVETLYSGTFPIRAGNISLGSFGNPLRVIEPGIFVLPETSAPASNETFYMYLGLGQNFIEVLQAGTFPLMHGVVAILLDNSEITSIEPGTFFVPDIAVHTRFEETLISLYSNRLSLLQAGTFPLRDGISWLELYSNQIASVEPGTFILPETTEYLSIHLNLSSNNITTVDEEVFGELMPYVVDLALEDNPLTCGCDLAWLVQSSDFMAKVDSEATCTDGTNLHDLDPVNFADCLI